MTKQTEQFVRLPVAALDHADLGAHELLVYMGLLRFRDHKTGVCFPSIKTLADITRLSKDSVRRATARLEAKSVVKVERVKKAGSNANENNRYTVGLLSGDFRDYIGHSAQGRRVPKRKLSAEARARLSKAARRSHGGSEPLEMAPGAGGGGWELPPSGSELPGVVAGSHSNQLHSNQLHEADVTCTFDESAHVYFTAIEESRATDEQISYLKDLATLLAYEAGGGVPDDLLIARWRKLSRAEAHMQIRAYRRELGEPGGRDYPWPGVPEYEALSDSGKAFADSEGDPLSVVAWFGPTEVGA